MHRVHSFPGISLLVKLSDNVWPLIVLRVYDSFWEYKYEYDYCCDTICGIFRLGR